MDTRIELRSARIDDAATLALLSGQLGYPVTAAEMRTRLSNTLAAPERHAVFVAMTLDALSGWIHVMRVERLELPAHSEIAALVVSEGQRGQGIGARLIDAAIGWTQDAGLIHVTVRSRIERDDAHRFYRSQGFRMNKTQQVLTLDLSTRAGRHAS